MSEEQFNGLPMPVFTAFGWDGEEAAITFALSQLELFVNGLYAIISEPARFRLPFHGLNHEARVAWFGINREPELGPYVAFVARPSAFEMRISVTDPAAINRGLRAAEKDPQKWFKMLNDLGPGWYLQIEQRLKEEDAVDFSHYGDLFKDSVTELDFETCHKSTSRAAFLNSEEKWTTPIYVTRRLTADQASGMGRDLIKYMAVEVEKVLDIVGLFSRATKGAKSTTTKIKSKGTARKKKSAGRPPKVVEPAVPQTFSYVAELKGLHIRKGFINLTPGHWPFFAEGKRTETRPITINFEGKSDATSAVWRLQPDDQARLVLGEAAHAWVQMTFSANSKVTVNALKTPEDQIEVMLVAVE
ncbi:MAG: hypothetical protein AB8G95_25955 [Anaerolineae bacterium]